MGQSGTSYSGELVLEVWYMPPRLPPCWWFISLPDISVCVEVDAVSNWRPGYFSLSTYGGGSGGGSSGELLVLRLCRPSWLWPLLLLLNVDSPRALLMSSGPITEYSDKVGSGTAISCCTVTVLHATLVCGFFFFWDKSGTEYSASTPGFTWRSLFSGFLLSLAVDSLLFSPEAILYSSIWVMMS